MSTKSQEQGVPAENGLLQCLLMYYQLVVSSALFSGVVGGGGSTKHKDTQRLDKLIKKATLVVGSEQDSGGEH